MKRFAFLFLSLLFSVGCGEKDQMEGIPRMKIYINDIISYEFYDTELKEGESSLLEVETECSSYLYCVTVDGKIVYEKSYKSKPEDMVYPNEEKSEDGLWQIIQMDERTFHCKVKYNTAADFINFQFGDLEDCKGPGEFSMSFNH